MPNQISQLTNAILENPQKWVPTLLEFEGHIFIFKILGSYEPELRGKEYLLPFLSLFYLSTSFYYLLYFGKIDLALSNFITETFETANNILIIIIIIIITIINNI